MDASERAHIVQYRNAILPPESHNKSAQRRRSRNVLCGCGKEIRENFFCTISFGIGKAFVCLFTLYNVSGEGEAEHTQKMGCIYSSRRTYIMYIFLRYSHCKCFSYMDDCIFRSFSHGVSAFASDSESFLVRLEGNRDTQ